MLAGGCSSGRPARMITNTIGSAGGAMLGHAFGKGEALPTAVGAGAGLLASETLNFGRESAQERNFAEGYEKGQSDSAKRKYQSLVEQQRIAAADDERVTLLEVPLPERRVNGVHFAPATATLRITE